MDNLNLFGFDRNNFEYNNINNIMGMQEQNIMNNNIINMYNNMNANNLNKMNNNNNINLNAFNNINNIGFMNHYNNFNNFNNINVINNMNNINNINNLNININDNYNYRLFNSNDIYNHGHNNIKIKNIKNVNMYDDKISGKFTCKYEILIENDPEFQIARKLIGSKGYNMKQIINEFKTEGEAEPVKLRLRGKGSGYKEGPQNKESDEPLHLCVSSKTKEQMIKACFLVNQLLEKINEEYKRFCRENGIKPKTDKIARKMENQNIGFRFNN
jgi:hypothetical protein